jgi:anti-sigma B factor antagonist
MAAGDSRRRLSVEPIEGDDSSLLVLLVQGEIDLANADQLMDAVPDDRDRLIIDLAFVPFIDSIGLRALVLRVQRLQRRGVRIAITSPSEQVARLFQLTAVDRVLDIHPSQEAGRRALAD